MPHPSRVKGLAGRLGETVETAIQQNPLQTIVKHMTQRARADRTQEEVARRMETSQATVAKMEGSRVNPSVKTLKRFAAATGTRLKITFEPGSQTS